MNHKDQVVWRRVNGELFEYAIQQGQHGDEFVRLLEGSCLRRSLDARGGAGGRGVTSSKDVTDAAAE
jgi:hypothetical protein